MDIYEKSLEILKRIVKVQKKYNFKIYLLGGWAVWCYNPYMKSKDIDLIIEKRNFWKLNKLLIDLGFKQTVGTGLKKKSYALLWEDEKIEIDVYDEVVGDFPIKELIQEATEKNINKSKVSVLSLTTLFMLKAYTALERFGSAKGEKDLSDLAALLEVGWSTIDFKKVNQKVNLKQILRILLHDFKTASKIYPLQLNKYKQIKSYLEKKQII